MLSRKIEQQLEEWRQHDRHDCLVIRGARQVGKTFTITRFIEEHYSHHVVLDFVANRSLCAIFDGDLNVDRIIATIRLQFTSFEPVPGQTAIFLDEIQECPNARTALKSFAADGRYRVIASGSLLGLNYREVRSYPVGYERVIEMRPLDFEEFLWAVGVDPTVIEQVRAAVRGRRPLGRFVLDKLDELFRTYMVVGGMPEAVETYLQDSDLTSVRNVQQKILTGYRDDVSKYAAPKDRNRIYACFDSIPNQLAQDSKKFIFTRINGEAIARYDTYAQGLDWLSDAGIILKCPNLSEPKLPLEERVRPNFFKIYLQDPGLLTAMYPADIARAVMKGDARVNRGALAENVTAGSLAQNGIPPRFFGSGALEIDFIAEMNLQTAAIEVKSGNNNRAKSLAAVRAKYGVKRRIKLEQTDIEVTADGAEHYPLFAGAFVDAMYDSRPDLHYPVTGVDELNAAAKSSRPIGRMPNGKAADGNHECVTMTIPPLKKEARNREFNAYSQDQRDAVVFGWLFDSEFTRTLDNNVLNLDSDKSCGYQSMGILHHMGLNKKHQGLFECTSPQSAIELLAAAGHDYDEVRNSICRYCRSHRL